MYLIYDTETTGLPKNYNVPISDSENWPRCIQIAWQLHDEMGQLVEHQDFMIQPEGFNIPYESEQVHGISTKLAQKEGIPLKEGLQKFNEALSKAQFVIGHNVDFDINIMGAEFYRADIETPLMEMPVLDTCSEVTATLCEIPGGRGGKFKLPTNTELYEYLFGEDFAEAHNATADVEATTRSFLELIRRRVFNFNDLQVHEGYFEDFNQKNPGPIAPIGLKHLNLKKASAKLKKQKESTGLSSHQIKANEQVLAGQEFVHLHNHTQFSILQSTISVDNLVNDAIEEGMPAVALTDHGNMMGAFEFVKAINAHNQTVAQAEDDTQKPLKAIVGCEFFVCEDHLNKNRKDNGFQMVLIAKNKHGYQNLIKLSSIAYTDGFYYVPRIDKKLIEQHKEDVIALTGNLQGEIAYKVLNVGEKQAEEALLWWKEQFGEDLYVELMRHSQEDENHVNEVLVRMAKTHDIKLVATNNTYYSKEKDANAHDILLCVRDGEKQSTPVGRGRGYRYGLPNQEYYFKSTSEMKALFKDLPEAILNTVEIADKIEPFALERDILLPAFKIPEKFKAPKDEEDGGKRGENKYLRYLTYEGAKKKYKEITPEIRERLDFELSVIRETGYPGYFLIVEDFIRSAKEMGVSVGPGRGSAAGSAVAYCLDITTIDPIKYDLLFERFLNPERVSMPDIDTDFDDAGRGLVMKYVIEKYGANQVAQIITYGSMAAKSAIRDTARVLDLPLNEADYLAKLIPDTPGTTLKTIFNLEEKKLNEKFRPEEVQKINELLNIADGNDLQAQTLNQARVLEGSIRNTGIHACGVIITPSDITNFVPVARAKDSDLYVTQFDNHVVESAGLLKMDFLGLKTLSLIRDTVKIIKGHRGIDINPDKFSLEDEETYKLFQRGDTVGVFQYESPGMQKYLRELKPTVFADLIAMNALYRPGPMEYIPSFIRRKHGEEEIAYDLPEMEEILKETYGVTVYQEQVMLLSRKLAGFSRGEADVLRKAMGKKKIAVLNKMEVQFLEGGAKNGHPKEILKKIWTDWKSFARYAFNKSHSTCYAWVAYQTAYLKAHYPAEFMASVLSNNMNDIKKVTFFMEECKRMKLPVLSPDVNESFYKFSVNNSNAIRFGMGAVKGVGRAAVETIVKNRKKEGLYRSIFDLAKRIDLRAANKKAFENLALAGGFDCFTGTHRSQYFVEEGDGVPFIEKVLKYAARYQENKNSSQTSLFGESSGVTIPEPQVPPCEDWSTMKKLRQERDVVGIYISGHPLDDFKNEIKHFCHGSVSDFKKQEEHLNQELSVAGIVTDVQHLVSRNGKGWAKFVVEDYEDSYEFKIFGEEYLKFRHFLVLNNFVYIKAFIREGWVNRKTGQRGNPRVSYRAFKQLQDVMSEFSKKLTIQIDIDELKEEKIQQLQDITRNFKGDKKLKFVVYELKDRIKVHMNSRKTKVEICSELLDQLAEEHFHCRVN